MGAQANAAPVIIKRKKVISGGGHHGGAWKVAYADFVTAMMAFFMLMWLLNATTEQQRKGIADYFSPTIPINRISGGGDGVFGGDSIFSEEVMARSGTGATAANPTEAARARGDSGLDADGAAEEEIFEDLEAALQGHGGESAVMENAMRHVITRITDEGLVIELFDLADATLFEEKSAVPTQLMLDLIAIVAQTTKAVTNGIAVGSHVRADPVVVAKSPVWELSAQRADQTRQVLKQMGVNASRIKRVIGHADRSPAVHNTMSIRNNRIEIILLRNVRRR